MNPRIRDLLHLLNEGYGPKAWHGTTLRDSVRSVSFEEARWRPGLGRHNIWELVLHLAYWKYAVRRRLERAPRGAFSRAGSDWPAIADPSADGWLADIALLGEVHAALVHTVRRFPVRRLNAREVGKWTNAEHIAGVAAHDLYHTGQIQLIKTLMPGH
jgi:uncharacterized damage-inducible protein DinB